MWSIKPLVEPGGVLRQRALRSCSSLIPLKSLRQDFLECLFQEALIECIPSGHELFTENLWNTKSLYLLHGKIALTSLFEDQHIISAGESLLPIRCGIGQACSAHALEDSTLLVIDSERLDQLLSWSQVSEYLISELSIKRTLGDDIEWMKTVLQSNIPMNLLGMIKRLLHRDIPYVFYRDTGRRSRSAAYLLAKQGYNACVMAGGYLGQKLSSSLTEERTYLLRDGELVKSIF